MAFFDFDVNRIAQMTTYDAYGLVQEKGALSTIRGRSMQPFQTHNPLLKFGRRLVHLMILCGRIQMGFPSKTNTPKQKIYRKPLLSQYKWVMT
tara:strand:+ start:1746 stop:2024 length:279 start_codon:yes stop_codon:yes gene_type:complete